MEKKKHISLRFTEAELKELMEKKTEPTLAGWLKKIAFNQESPIVKKTDPALLYELNKIGVNLNQISKYLNNKNLNSIDKAEALLELGEITELLQVLLDVS